MAEVFKLTPPMTANPASIPRLDLTRKPRWRSIRSRILDVAVAVVTLAALVPARLGALHGRQPGRGKFSLVDALAASPRRGRGWGRLRQSRWSAPAFWSASARSPACRSASSPRFFSPSIRRARTARGYIRFCAKILSGLPSILAGVFIFSVLVVTSSIPSRPSPADSPSASSCCRSSSWRRRRRC